MEQGKLYQVLSVLSPPEKARLNKFLQSPYFNHREEPYLLANRLYYHIQKGVPVDRERLFKKIKPKKSYRDLKLRHWSSELLKLVEQFLVIEGYSNDEIAKGIMLAKQYRLRDLDKHYSQAYRSTRDELDAWPYRNDQYFQRQFRLESEHMQFLSDKEMRTEDPNLQVTSDALDQAFVLDKLRYACYMINYQDVIDTAFDIKFINYIIKEIEKDTFKDNVAIQIYYQIWKTYNQQDDEGQFYKLIHLLKEQSAVFDEKEALILYNFAMNYCINKINEGDQHFLKQLFEIYKQLLLTGLILEDDELSPWQYKNIAVVGLRLNEFEWVQQFLDNYREYIPEDFRENAYTYNMAKLHFYRKQYDEVMHLLMRVEYEDLFYSLDSKSMLLKTYYELNEFEALDSLSESFRIYLRRKKKLSEHHRSTYMNFIKFLKKATRVQPGDGDQVNKLIGQLDKTKHIADKNWLKEKMNELA